MAKFKIKVTTILGMDIPEYKSVKDLNNSFDIGSRCWMPEIIDALHDIAQADEGKGVCNTCGFSEIEAIEVIG